MNIDEIMKVAETLSHGWWLDDETWPFPTELPKRPWQGLTDDEITELGMEISGRTMDECVRAIEDKLKEKNDH